MTRIHRAAAAACATALLVALAGCSDDTAEGANESQASANASPTVATTAAVDDFCVVYREAVTSLASIGSDGPTEEQWEVVQGHMRDLAELGGPDGMSDEARAGLEVFTDVFLSYSAADMQRLKDEPELPGVTEEQKRQSRTFTTETLSLCDVLDEAPSPSE